MTLPTTEVDVARIVKDKSEIYQPEGPRIPGLPEYENRPSNATPAAMRILLDELKAYTEEVQRAATQSGLTRDVVMGQWQSDMSNWNARLNHYYEELKKVAPENANNLAGADQIYFTVTSPLLDGYYYEVLPGIVLNDEEKARMMEGPPSGASNKKPPGLYLPFSLGNQVNVYTEHQQQRWDQFWQDVWDNTKNLGGAVGRAAQKAGWAALPWLVGIGVAVGSAAVAGGIIYLIVKHQQAQAMAPQYQAVAAAPPR